MIKYDYDNKKACSYRCLGTLCGYSGKWDELKHSQNNSQLDPHCLSSPRKVRNSCVNNITEVQRPVLRAVNSRWMIIPLSHPNPTSLIQTVTIYSEDSQKTGQLSFLSWFNEKTKQNKILSQVLKHTKKGHNTGCLNIKAFEMLRWPCLL